MYTVVLMVAMILLPPTTINPDSVYHDVDYEVVGGSFDMWLSMNHESLHGPRCC
jgi:hypothetical protein